MDAVFDAVGGGTYPALALAVALDAIFPLLPGEAGLTAAAIAAGHGELFIGWVILFAAIGAIIGDNIVYFAGAQLGSRVEKKLVRGEKGQRLDKWARRNIHHHGAQIVLVARFLPGGRTAAAFACGSLDMPWRQFFAIDCLAALAWAIYIGLLGYLGGEFFEGSWWKPLLTSLIGGLALAGLVEVYRRWRHPTPTTAEMLLEDVDTTK